MFRKLPKSPVDVQKEFYRVYLSSLYATQISKNYISLPYLKKVLKNQKCYKRNFCNGTKDDQPTLLFHVVQSGNVES